MKALRPAATALLCAAILTPLPAAAQEGAVVEGTATMEDADIVKIGDARIILWGVDAPEKRQKCRFSGDREWDCYETARRQMELLIEAGPWTCTPQEEDRFGNLLAICEVEGTNINSYLVRKGYAAAYLDQTDAFAADQDAAKTEKLGLWQDGASFDEPWLVRAAQSLGGYR